MAEKFRQQPQSYSQNKREESSLQDFAQKVKQRYFEGALFEQLLQLNTSDVGLQKKLPVDAIINAVEKFIKNYDFNGRLVEFFFEVNKPVRCTLQLIIFLLEQKMVRISARILEIKIEY